MHCISCGKQARLNPPWKIDLTWLTTTGKFGTTFLLSRFRYWIEWQLNNLLYQNGKQAGQPNIHAVLAMYRLTTTEQMQEMGVDLALCFGSGGGTL